ncbi:hypothetical protein [Paenibacillus anseongense]|uniref:hypothetical protein n=1 Tax=Paenibacillus anseongense TaxID=2682845 RepID=UPI002DBC5547|nr:hypothetical protein [Paenibacillus anseongense]MEC0270475.1 hypothetical protein [Paenibacillus anseongense]
MLEELIKVVDANLKSFKANIARNKKYFDYPFTNNCDHYYKLILMHKQFECWEQFSALLSKFWNTRCIEFTKNGDQKLDFYKRCEEFENQISFEKLVSPGFITQKTLAQMIEYMRTLGWKVDELVRVISQNYGESCN